MNYYNENDPNAVAWLRGLIAAELIPDGVVDDRSIADVQAEDLKGFAQHHFFAGVGGWPFALQLAGWPKEEAVWTGSCPCQPFSQAGKRSGKKDKRHLWPEFLRLIAKRAPTVVFGEQVASPLGRDWLAGVRADLEALAYGVGAADLCAASVGAPHIRQRLFWVADAASLGTKDGHISDESPRQHVGAFARTNCRGGVGDDSARNHTTSTRDGYTVGIHGRVDDANGVREDSLTGIRERTEPDSAGGPWDDFVLVLCTDGKVRRVESGLQPLVDGVPFRLADGRTTEGASRVQLLRGIGNAIVPQVAATFVTAYMETASLDLTQPPIPPETEAAK